jgi:hypothetical protein
MNATIKKPRKKLTLVEQKAKLEADEAKIAQQKAKIEINSIALRFIASLTSM